MCLPDVAQSAGKLHARTGVILPRRPRRATKIRFSPGVSRQYPSASPLTQSPLVSLSTVAFGLLNAAFKCQIALKSGCTCLSHLAPTVSHRNVFKVWLKGLTSICRPSSSRKTFGDHSGRTVVAAQPRSRQHLVMWRLAGRVGRPLSESASICDAVAAGRSRGGF